LKLKFVQKFLKSTNLHNLNLKYVQQSSIISVLHVRNNFIRKRVTVKSKDPTSALFRGQTSKEYSLVYQFC